jgi:hypothetical protein
VIFGIGIIIFFGIVTHKSPIQRKLKGFWNIEFENSYIVRDSIYEFSEMIIRLEKDTIHLPYIRESGPFDEYFYGKHMPEDSTFFDAFWADKKNVEINTKWWNDREKNATGIWEIISTNPDSVFFNVPHNPLHGKYAIQFFIDNKGWEYANMPRLIYKMELTNDSTRLICNKAGFIYKSEFSDWEGKN